MNDFTTPPEEQEYIDKVNRLVADLAGGYNGITNLGKAGKIFAIMGDTEFCGFIMAMISYGYILKEDEIMGQKHNFSIKDFGV